ncbi:MAG: hypothetical protein L6V93_00960 [Clostridiales bacterium]|nr:MAG: hypothetical protein L6V93_00960 [Clostridiales bacterium]
MSSYYASKAYVLRLDLAVNTELKKMISDVRISTLCPGPVKTEFDEVANVKFSLKGLDARFVAEYAVKKMFEKKGSYRAGLADETDASASEKSYPIFILCKNCVSYTKEKNILIFA